MVVPLLVVSLGIAFALWLYAGWTLCGLFGCYPGGAVGPNGGFVTALFSLVCSGAVAAVPLWAVPWTANKRKRTWAGVGVAAVVAVSGFVFIIANSPGWAG